MPLNRAPVPASLSPADALAACNLHQIRDTWHVASQAVAGVRQVQEEGQRVLATCITKPLSLSQKAENDVERIQECSSSLLEGCHEKWVLGPIESHV